MNATARTARQITTIRRREAAALKRPHTLKSHALRAGVEPTVAGGVAGALRSKGKTIGITGRQARMFRKDEVGQKMWREPVRGARRFSVAEFATVVLAYNPRAQKYVAARQQLLAYAK